MMKKWLLVLMVALSLVAVPAVAQRGFQVNLEWDQPNIPSDFWGWKMWVGTTAGGPYDYVTDAQGNAIPLFEVQYDPANPDGPFAGTGNILAPDNAETTFYFVVNAWDTEGNFSPNSNEVSASADFLPPEAPVLSITGTIVISPP